jgi:molybdate transport system substrate-binding protein
VQKITIFSAGVSTTSKEPDAAKSLIKFLASPQAAPVLIKAGLEPIPAGGKS